MKQRIATLCCLMVIQSSIVSAGEAGNTAPQQPVSVTQRESKMGPLRRASLSRTTWTLRSETASRGHQDQDAAPAADTRSWVERHPVWTGAMVGFAAGVTITYMATEGGHKPDQLLDLSGLRDGAAIVFGGVTAGIGALAGWGIGRNQHDGYHDRARKVEPQKKQN